MLLLDEAISAPRQAIGEDGARCIGWPDGVSRTGAVVAAHRFSTIHNCDVNVIAVLDKGKLEEKGTHTSLLAKGPGGGYYSLATLQIGPNNAVQLTPMLLHRVDVILFM